MKSKTSNISEAAGTQGVLTESGANEGAKSARKLAKLAIPDCTCTCASKASRHLPRLHQSGPEGLSWSRARNFRVGSLGT